MKVFNNYSKYYDLLYKDKNYNEEADFIHTIISQNCPSAKNIFEMGCGTGLHAIALAKKGYSIDGIDFSDEMLKIAKKRLLKASKTISSKLSFLFGDVRKFSSKKKYDVVISVFHIGSYMTTNDDLQAFFNTASRHLSKDGLFIFDCWYGPTVLTERPEIRVKKMEDENIKIVRTATPEMLPNKNLVNVNYDIRVNDKKTKQNKNYKETHVMRYLFQPEIEMFLKNSGFELLSSQEWLSGKTLGFNTWSGCFVAKLI